MGVDRLICFGARRGKQQTFTLLEEWAPKVRVLDSDAALAELTLRYFQGHGPATLPDFVWWSGLKISDARTGLAMVSAQLESVTVNDTVYWMNPASLRMANASLVAAECGYSDQAHMIREFFALSGATPAELLKRYSSEGGIVEF